MKRLASVVAADSTNVLIQNISGIPTETLTYVTANIQAIGTYVNSSTVTFNRGWLTAPAGFPATSLDNFSLFCNGLVIETTAVTSFTQSSGVTTLVINPALLGYSFSPTDEVVAIGKFA